MTDDIAQYQDVVLNNLIVFFSMNRSEGDFVTIHYAVLRRLVGVGGVVI